MKSILGREANMNNRKNSHNSLGKKTIGVLLMTVLVLSLMPAQTVNAAAFKKQKSKAKYKVTITNANSETVIEKGQKFKLQYNVRKIVGAKTSKTKAKFKSSNKKIATVSSKGVIKAKKKGTVKITVYCKKKPKKRKTIKIRVGTQVHSISLKGYQHLRVGRSTSIKATVNKNETNKKINWSSSNASIVRIDSKGKIKALKPGKATIYATAADGSGKSARIDIVVSSYKKPTGLPIEVCIHRQQRILPMRLSLQGKPDSGVANATSGKQSTKYRKSQRKLQTTPMRILKPLKMIRLTLLNHQQMLPITLALR